MGIDDFLDESSEDETGSEQQEDGNNQVPENIIRAIDYHIMQACDNSGVELNLDTQEVGIVVQDNVVVAERQRLAVVIAVTMRRMTSESFDELKELTMQEIQNLES